MSESAASYVSVLEYPDHPGEGQDFGEIKPPEDSPRAFSLAKFIPLLRERIAVINPFTRMFLVGWITLLDSIPDLELVSHLPSFLDGLFKFLSDNNPDVHTATQVLLERFLREIKNIARLKQGLRDRKGGTATEGERSDIGSVSVSGAASEAEDAVATGDEDSDDGSRHSDSGDDADSDDGEEDWVPGQDTQLDYAKILDILA